MNVRLSASLFWLGMFCFCWVMLSAPKIATAQGPVQPPVAPGPDSADETHESKRTPEQQAKLDEAIKLYSQSVRLFQQGKYADAISYAGESLNRCEAALPKDDPQIATSCTWLAYLHRQAGNSAEAIPLLQRALEILQKARGQNDPDVATACNNLAELYRNQGKYAEALPLYQQAVKIREKALGADDPDVAQCLNNLALLYKAQGKYAEALPLFQRSLKICEKNFGPEHPSVASACSNFAQLYQDEGNFADAMPLLQRALKISEKALGPDDPAVAAIVSNLGVVYQSQRNYDKALEQLQRALKIYEKALGPEHPYVAAACNNLAALYQSQGNYDAALALHQRALKICEKAFGSDHPDVAIACNDMAEAYRAKGSYAEALPYYQRAIKIDEKVLGADHPGFATEITNLALLYDAMGKFSQAASLSHQAMTILRAELERTAVVQSERQQLQMAEMVRSYLLYYLSLARKAHVPAEQVYADVLAWKGSVSARQQAMRQLRASSTDPKVAAMYKQLTETARQLDSLSRAKPAPEQADAYKQQLSELNTAYEALQQQLAAASTDYRRQQAEKKIAPADLMRALPPDTVLVDIVEYRQYVPPKEKGQKENWEQRLAAFVIRSDAPIEWIELGESGPINELIDRWRQSYSPDDGADLRRLVWQPLEDKLTGAATVLVSPDGALDRFPLAALPGKKEGTYLIEDVVIATVPVPRLLPELLGDSGSTQSAKPKAKDSPPSLLTIGEVDFQAALSSKAAAEQLALRAPVNRDGGGWQFGPLEGTRAEIVAINDSFQQRFPDAPHKSLRKAQATKQAVCEAMPLYSYVHLATHGFFAPPKLKSALDKVPAEDSAESRSDGRDSDLDVTGYHPDLLSGLALAGANQQAEPGQDDGILTAMAVEELDLSHVQLATLSACETGLGQTAGGEGVLGLQRAFQLAGTKSTVTTLWKIPDKASQLLMTDFYENLWNGDKPMSKLESLRQAQLKMLREGSNRGLELPDDHTSGTKVNYGGRMSPFFWAAFELSGDWR